MKHLILALLLITTLSTYAQDDLYQGASRPKQIINATSKSVDTLKLSYKNNLDKNQRLHIPLEYGYTVFSEVIRLDNISADEIYDRAMLAIVDVFKSSVDALQLTDKKNNTIIAKGLEVWSKNPDALITRGFDVLFTLKVECKEGKCRVSMYGFESRSSTYSFERRVDLGAAYVTCNEAEARSFGIKRNGALKSNLYGYSWLAWKDTSDKIATAIKNKIQNSVPNNSNQSW